MEIESWEVLSQTHENFCPQLWRIYAYCAYLIVGNETYVNFVQRKMKKPCQFCVCISSIVFHKNKL